MMADGGGALADAHGSALMDHPGGFPDPGGRHARQFLTDLRGESVHIAAVGSITVDIAADIFVIHPAAVDQHVGDGPSQRSVCARARAQVKVCLLYTSSFV